MLAVSCHPGWLCYIRDYTIQLYRDYNEPLKGSYEPTSISWNVTKVDEVFHDESCACHSGHEYTLMVLNMYGNPWCAGLSLQAGIPTRHCHCNMSGNPLEICFDEFKVYTVW